MAKLILKDVSKKVGSQLILDELNIRIEAGEFLVIVGPSGCGKSTLLRLIAGLEPLSSGSILLNEQCLNNLAPAARDMAMVFQNYALYPHMSVFDNMAYGLKMRRFNSAEIKHRIAHAAQLLHLTPYLNRKPHALSGGQRQRVAMGRAMVRSPAVFLFDEPLSNLDAKLRMEMRHEIKRLHERLNTTSIYVTHDQTEAMTMADKILVLNHGKVEQIGSPLTLYHQPETLFVAGFIGHYPLNILKGFFDKKTQCVHSTLGIQYEAHELTAVLADKVELILAIRAEEVLLCEPQHPHAVCMDIEWVDEMGADCLVRMKSVSTQERLIIRLSSKERIESRQAYVVLPKLNIHLFHQHSEKRIGEWCETNEQSLTNS